MRRHQRGSRQQSSYTGNTPRMGRYPLTFALSSDNDATVMKLRFVLPARKVKRLESVIMAFCQEPLLRLSVVEQTTIESAPYRVDYIFQHCSTTSCVGAEMCRPGAKFTLRPDIFSQLCLSLKIIPRVIPKSGGGCNWTECKALHTTCFCEHWRFD